MTYLASLITCVLVNYSAHTKVLRVPKSSALLKTLTLSSPGSRLQDVKATAALMTTSQNSNPTQEVDLRLPGRFQPGEQYWSLTLDVPAKGTALDLNPGWS